MGIWDEPGCFCEVYGTTLDNRILELILVNGECDWAIGDIARDLKISRPKAYEVIADFEKKGIVKKTRIIGRTQLYTINKDNPISKIYLRNFNECLNMVVEEYTTPKKKSQAAVKTRRAGVAVAKTCKH
jgi:predicted transcriptional regulator